MISHPKPQPFLIVLILLLVVLFVPSSVAAQDGGDPPSPTTPVNFYGANFIAPFEPWTSLADEMGASVVRWQFNWRDHEPSQGQWNWTLTDKIIPAWRDGGIRIHALLHNPPDWAKVNPPDGLQPRNLDLPWNDPNNHWARYCYEFANRYKGQIDSYEIWNEPDLKQYFEGNAQEYYNLMRACYQAIKAVDPDTPVVMAGMAVLVDRQFMQDVIRLAAEDPQGPAYNYFFDAANIHMYADPDLVWTLAQWTRGVLAENGLGDKPIWITEANAALLGYGDAPDTADWYFANEQEQAWYILQAIANAHAARAERFMVFRFADDDMNLS
ncbi:MAG: hypothetical protein GYB68_15825 [Chloroflexi bacterium]|nr:hypothetical protein [Chloroflexota bacterium]